MLWLLVDRVSASGFSGLRERRSVHKCSAQKTTKTSKNSIGVIVNQNNQHWVAIKKEVNPVSFWLLDSLAGRPRQMTSREVRDYIARWPHSYLVGDVRIP